MSEMAGNSLSKFSMKEVAPLPCGAMFLLIAKGTM
jgi:hypothetical protein